MVDIEDSSEIHEPDPGNLNRHSDGNLISDGRCGLSQSIPGSLRILASVNGAAGAGRV